MSKCNYTEEQISIDDRVIVSPCKPGDPVFYICCTSNGPEIFERPFKIEWVFQIGSTVFLEKDEAKAYLKQILY